jgi:hypothetical protein
LSAGLIEGRGFVDDELLQGEAGDDGDGEGRGEDRDHPADAEVVQVRAHLDAKGAEREHRDDGVHKKANHDGHHSPAG